MTNHDPSTDLCRRRSLITRLIVDLACDFPDIHEAAKLLARYHVPLEVTRRVLLAPHLRRSSP